MTNAFTNIPAELLISLAGVIENNSDAHFVAVETAHAGKFYAVFVFLNDHEFKEYVGQTDGEKAKHRRGASSRSIAFENAQH